MRLSCLLARPRGCRTLSGYTGRRKPPPLPRRPVAGTTGNDLVVSATTQLPPVRALPFELSAAAARLSFLDWARAHGALGSATKSPGLVAEIAQLLGQEDPGGDGRNDAFSFRPLYLPFWSFAVAGDGRRHVYAGRTWDPAAVLEALSDDAMMATTSAGQDFEEQMSLLPPSSRGGGNGDAAEHCHAHVDDFALGAGVAWEIARTAGDGGNSPAHDSQLQCADRLLLPCFCFAYTHMGVQMLTWVSATSGEVCGISHLVFWEDTAMQQKAHTALKQSMNKLAHLDRRT
eukprot:COSAG05_NODE_1790_length_4082_cov_21.604162_4_plen_288_part_00